MKESHIVLAYYVVSALITASTPLRFRRLLEGYLEDIGYDVSLWFFIIMATFIHFCYWTDPG